MNVSTGDPTPDLSDDEMDWDQVGELQARYEAAFNALNRRRLHHLEARVDAIETLIADRLANGRGNPYL